MKALLFLLFTVAVAGAVLSSHQHKPFELRIDDADAKPGAWPRDAQVEPVDVMPQLLVTPCPISPQNNPIVEAEREA